MTKQPLSTVLVTGASGFIGRHLIRSLLGDGHAVLALQHRELVETTAPGLKVVGDIREISTTRPLDAIVNLAGARILGPPWTPRRREALLSSRLDTTVAVVELIGRLAHPPPRLISASAIGYYGVRGDEPLDETAGTQPIFQSQLCARWEQAAARATALGSRVTCLRFGVVLGRDGGALPALLRPARLGLGAVMGTGAQGNPWIHVDDAVRLIRFAMAHDDLAGAVNAVAPGHVTQRQFQQILGSVLQPAGLAPGARRATARRAGRDGAAARRRPACGAGARPGGRVRVPPPGPSGGAQPPAAARMTG